MSKSKKRIWTIEAAENQIKNCGGRIDDYKIYMPPTHKIEALRDHKEEDDLFWSAYQFLRAEHDYDCDSDDPIAYIDIEDFLTD